MIRKLFHKIAVFALPLVLLCSCGGENPPQVEEVFKVSVNEIEIDAFGGQEAVRILSSEDWIVSSNQSWAKPMTASGKASDSEVTVPIIISENNSEKERSATLTFKNLSFKTLEVKILQAGSTGQSSAERGIKTAEDLVAFAKACNSGESISNFMANGEIVLRGDIDVSSIKDWTPIGTSDKPFTGVFNGSYFKIYGIGWTLDMSKTTGNGLFGYIKNATIKNLTFGNEGDLVELNGTCSSTVTAAAICANAEGGTFLDVVNYVSLKTNNKSGGKNLYAAGICANAVSSTFTKVKNYGHIECFGNLVGGIAARLENSKLTGSANYGLVEGLSGDKSLTYADALVGGLAATLDAPSSITTCENSGNVFSHLGSRAGGFAAESSGKVQSCTNFGAILSDGAAQGYGPAWGCVYNPNADTFIKNTGRGYVGSYTQFKDAPESAPDAMFYNAILSPAAMFDTEDTSVDWTKDSYYDWTLDETKTLANGCVYSRYICTNVPRRVCVLEIDLTSSEVEITTAYSDDIVPNPNANKNSNNGPKIRETLSQICQRKRQEGQDIIAGINTGFFDSNDGISRAPHIEEGEAVYINNPTVRKSLPNHDWAFTVFDDKTASCGKKTFGGSSYGEAGKFKIGGTEFVYYSVNDTIVRHVSKSYQANLYTYRYVQKPHPAELPNVTNSLATNAYYLVCKFSSTPMKVNNGWADAVVTAIHDGRTSALASGPYVTGKDEFVLALSGDVASKVSGLASTGTALQIRSDIAIDGVTKPIFTQNGTMFEFMIDGKDNSNSAPAGHTNLTTYDPVTFAAVSQDAKRVWLIEVDGRQSWFSMGLKSYEMYRIAKKLGAWTMTRFDGGGSSCMWVYDSAKGSGALVNSPSDSKGERSVLNFILIRKK